MPTLSLSPWAFRVASYFIRRANQDEHGELMDFGPTGFTTCAFGKGILLTVWDNLLYIGIVILLLCAGFSMLQTGSNFSVPLTWDTFTFSIKILIMVIGVMGVALTISGTLVALVILLSNWKINQTMVLLPYFFWMIFLGFLCRFRFESWNDKDPWGSALHFVVFLAFVLDGICFVLIGVVSLPTILRAINQFLSHSRSVVALILSWKRRYCYRIVPATSSKSLASEDADR